MYTKYRVTCDKERKGERIKKKREWRVISCDDVCLFPKENAREKSGVKERKQPNEHV